MLLLDTVGFSLTQKVPDQGNIDSNALPKQMNKVGKLN